MTQLQDITSPMTAIEKRATVSLASIYALRMLGLFMILPVLSLFAEQLEGSTPLLMGLAISVYGLTQAILQIPFGLLSDKFGRKKIIVIGLLLFSAGSIVAAVSTDIYGVLLGRALQGAGAIAAAIMAMVADLTQESHRTKAMAMIGASIGLSFAVAVTAGPLLAGLIGVQGLFWVTAVLAIIAIVVIIFVVPNPQQLKVHRDAELIPAQLGHVLKNADLLRLDYGIFILHLILTACFVVVPLLLRDAGLLANQHWIVYLCVMLFSMAIVVPFIILAEKKRKMKPVFLMAIAVILLATIGLWLFHQNLFGIIGFLWLFFCGFNLLEATLPSLISKTAPGDLKGTAMGAYSSSQFMGAFIGGLVGGWCYGQWGASSVFIFCALAVSTWLLVAFSMNTPRYLANLLVSLGQVSQAQAEECAKQMLKIAGIEEVKLHYKESEAYLKVDNEILDREQLQKLLDEFVTA